MTQKENRQIWGLAKSPELQLTSEELHLVVMKLTGKESLRELEARETRRVTSELIHMKDRAARKEREDKRTRGNTATAYQRKKVYMLARRLGWDNRSRVNGMCRRMFGVGALEWLDYRQCSKLIEALKAMAEREEGQDGSKTETDDAAGKTGACGG